VMRVVRKDGTERIWMYRNILYAEPGARPYVLGHAIDVTERAAAEEAVRRSHVQTLEATSRLAGRVAHAFNNLLTVIIGSSEILLADQPFDPDSRAHLQAIMRAATRGATVTRQLLAVGGQQPIDRIAVDMNAIITTLEASLRRVAGPMAMCTFNLEPSLPDVEGDSKQIEQVLLHLAGNAGDAIGDEGAITITTSSTISEDVRARNHPEIDPREYVWLTVRESGVGMDARTREHVFEPYFTAKSAGFSAGLGLPVVYGIVNQLGGAIAVDSEVGHGTSFTIALRRASTIRAGRSTAGQSPTEKKGSRTILLVDDEDDVRSVMKSALCQRGYNVLDAASGADAIHLLADHSGTIDMLVTDVLMPGMSGRELYEHLARRHPGLRVLYVSGYADDVFAHEQEWGTAFLPKPFSLDTLAQRVCDGLHSA
jgi:two-component system cell cycle sensor histidine kinase/response regulator CckA